MCKHETWRTRQYWGRVGGLLIEEFLAIRRDRNLNIAQRLVDGVIVLGEPKKIQTGGTYDLYGKDIIVVQTKANRLGMYLMGQSLFSSEIMKRYKPKTISTVAICGRGDTEMEDLCKDYGIEVIVMEEPEKKIS